MNSERRVTIAACAVAASLFVLPAFGWQPPRPMAQKLAPYVSSPQTIVDRMLKVADLKRGETLYDLGSGDGRIVFSAARDFGARAVGVEISEPLVRRAREQAESLGLKEKVEIIQGDMMEVDLSSAQVVALYLLTEANSQLKPKLAKELKPGSRVVSLDFKIPGWKPSKVEKIEAHRHPYTIYLYELPQK